MENQNSTEIDLIRYHRLEQMKDVSVYSEKQINELLLALLTVNKGEKCTISNNEMKKKIDLIQKTLSNENVWSSNFRKILDDFLAFYAVHDYDRATDCLRSLLSKLKDIDIQEVRSLIESNEQDLRLIDGKDIYLLIGLTGAGKSTILHYLGGSKMVERVVGSRTCIVPETCANTYLERVVVGESHTISETKSIIPVIIQAHREVIICDTPGFGDTRGAEIDIANSYILKRAIDNCNSVKPIVVVSKNMGDKLQHFPKLTHVLVEMIPNRMNLQCVKYVFNKYTSDEARGLFETLCQISREINDREKNRPGSEDQSFKQIIEDMVQKCLYGTIAVDLKNEDNLELLKKICDTFMIQTPKYNINTPLGSDSKDKIKSQMIKHFSYLKTCLYRDMIDLALYKADELLFLKQVSNLLEIGYELSDHCVKLRDEFEEVCKEKSAYLNSKIANNEKVLQSDLTQYIDCIEKSRNFDLVMEKLNSKGELVKVETNMSSNFRETLAQKALKITSNIKLIENELDKNMEQVKVALYNLRQIVTSCETNLKEFQTFCKEMRKIYTDACDMVFAGIQSYLDKGNAFDIFKDQASLVTIANEIAKINQYNSFSKEHDRDLNSVNENIKSCLEKFFNGQLGQTHNVLETKLNVNEFAELNYRDKVAELKKLENVDLVLQEANDVLKENKLSSLSVLREYIEINKIKRYYEENKQLIKNHLDNLKKSTDEFIREKEYGRVKITFDLVSAFRKSAQLNANLELTTNKRKIDEIEEVYRKIEANVTACIDAYRNESIVIVEQFFSIRSVNLSSLIDFLEQMAKLRWFDSYKSNYVRNSFQRVEKKIEERLRHTQSTLESIHFDLNNYDRLKDAVFRITRCNAFRNLLTDNNYDFSRATNLKDLIESIKSDFEKKLKVKLDFLKERFPMTSINTDRLEYELIENGVLFLRELHTAIKQSNDSASVAFLNELRFLDIECNLIAYLQARVVYLKEHFQKNFNYLNTLTNETSEREAEEKADEMLRFFKEVEHVEERYTQVCAEKFRENGECVLNMWTNKLIDKFTELNSNDLTDQSIENRNELKIGQLTAKLLLRFDDFLKRESSFSDLYYQYSRSAQQSDAKIKETCQNLIKRKQYAHLQNYINLLNVKSDRADLGTFKRLKNELFASLTNILNNTMDLIGTLSNDFKIKNANEFRSNETELRQIGDNVQKYFESKVYLTKFYESLDELNRKEMNKILNDIKKKLADRQLKLKTLVKTYYENLDLEAADRLLCELKQIELIYNIIKEKLVDIGDTTNQQQQEIDNTFKKNEQFEENNDQTVTEFRIELNAISDLETYPLREKYEILKKREEFIGLKKMLNKSVVNLFQVELDKAAKLDSIENNEYLKMCKRIASDYLPTDLKQNFVDELIEQTEKKIEENIINGEIKKDRVDMDKVLKKYLEYKEKNDVDNCKSIETFLVSKTNQMFSKFELYEKEVSNEIEMNKNKSQTNENVVTDDSSSEIDTKFERFLNEYREFSSIYRRFSSKSKCLDDVSMAFVDKLNALSDLCLKRYRALNYKKIDSAVDELVKRYKLECLLFDLAVIVPGVDGVQTQEQQMAFKKNLPLINSHLDEQMKLFEKDKAALENDFAGNIDSFKQTGNFLQLVDRLKESGLLQSNHISSINTNDIKKFILGKVKYLLDNFKSKKYIENDGGNTYVYQVEYEKFYEGLFNDDLSTISSINDALQSYNVNLLDECAEFMRSKMKQFYEEGEKFLSQLLNDIDFKSNTNGENAVDEKLSKKFQCRYYNLNECEKKSKASLLFSHVKNVNLFDENIKDYEESYLQTLTNKLNEIVQFIGTSKDIQVVARCLCILKELSSKLLPFKEKIESTLSKALNSCISQNGGFKWVAPLATALNLSLYGRKIVDANKVFESYNNFIFNKQTEDRDIRIVLDELIKTNSTNRLDSNHLNEFFDAYKSIFKDLINKYLKPNMDLTDLIANINSKAKEIRDILNNEAYRREFLKTLLWDNYVKKHLAYLVAHIFALHSLLKAQDFFKMNTDTVDTDCIFQAHPAQVIAIAHMLGFGYPNVKVLRNCLVQIGTGEGKSVTLAVLATVLALLDFEIYCVCYSKYLSRRDFNDFKLLFDKLALTDSIHYGTFNEVCEMVINEHGDLREIVNKYMLDDKIILEKNANSRFKLKVLLVDEVDVFFTNDFYGNDYNPATNLTHSTISDLIDYIWNKRTDRLTITQLKQSTQYQACIKIFGPWEELIKNACQQMLNDVSSFDAHKYEIKDDKIGYIEQDEVVFNVNYGYKTMFAYYYENSRGKISNKSLNDNKGIVVKMGSFSYAEVPRLDFKLILGVTGTLYTLNAKQTQIIENEYNIKLKAYMPSVYGKPKLTFKENDDLHVVNQENILSGIREEIERRVLGTDSVKRAIFVFFDTKDDFDAFNKYISMNANYLNRIVHLTEEMSDADKKEIVEGAVSNMVILIMKAFGRGTNFKTFDSQVKKDGVHVIQAFFSDDFAEEVQIKGRTARQGDKGSFSIVVFDNKLEKYQVFAKDLEENKNNLYEYLSRKRNAYRESAYQETIRRVSDLKPKHDQSIAFINDLVNEKKDEVKKYILKLNTNLHIGSGSNVSKTLILMDATGSMADLIEKTKNTLETMFMRIFEIMTAENQQNKAFQVKLCAYRNYSSPIDKILEMSTWESEPNNLIQFLKSISTSGGQGNEAIEIGLWQANQEHDLSQVIIIGDMPANTKSEVAQKRAGNANLAQSRYSQATYYEDELALLINKGIQVHAFYVGKKAKQNFTKIAEDSGGEHKLLDINSSRGSDMLINLVTMQILKKIDVNLEKAYTARYNP